MKNIDTRIVTFGVFDFFHYGHFMLFKNIKDKFGYNSFLTVCVQDEAYILKYKPDSKILYSTKQRVDIIKNISFVDDVKIYTNIDEDIKNIDFDIWIKGPDQKHKGFLKAIKYCKINNKTIYTIKRTKGISSSDLKINFLNRQAKSKS